MLLSIFIVLIILYSLVAIKVDEWISISALGFKTETPQLFLINPGRYSFIRSILFLGALATSFFLPIRLSICFIFLYIVWLGAHWVGRKLAIKTYRRVLNEMASEESDPKQKSEFELASRKSDKELINEILAAL